MSVDLPPFLYAEFGGEVRWWTTTLGDDMGHWGDAEHQLAESWVELARARLDITASWAEVAKAMGDELTIASPDDSQEACLGQA
jgi:hypothetical protein